MDASTAGAPPDRRPLWVAAGFVLGAALVFILVAYFRSGVWLSTSLDDTFIHFQYAKQLARGRLLQFNDGDVPTTGATSFLYLLVLAPGWLIGFRGIHLLIWAWVVNLFFYWVSGVVVFKLARRFTRRRLLSYLAMGVFLLNGPLCWGVFSQMEVALFSCVILLTFFEAVRLTEATAREEEEGGEGGVEEERGEEGATREASPQAGVPRLPRRLLLLGALLALARPEGMVMAGGLTIWLLWRHVFRYPSEDRPWYSKLAEAKAAFIPMATGVALVLLYLALTGRIATSAMVRSQLAQLPYDPEAYAEIVVEWLPMTLRILLEKLPDVLHPLTASLVLLGLAFWAATERLRRPGPALLVLLWLFLLSVFYALGMADRMQHDRYYLPYLGLILLVLWWALGWLADRSAELARAARLVALLIFVFTLQQTGHWALVYGANCRDIVNQHFKAVQWIEENTPTSARIAVNDAGAIPYLTQRYTYDLFGLVHEAFRRTSIEANYRGVLVWEALESLAQRPDYIFAYAEWFPQFSKLPVLSEVARFSVKKRTIVGKDSKIAWKVRWDILLDSTSLPPAVISKGSEVVDRLDIGDALSEESHHYRRLDSGWPKALIGQAKVDKNVLLDGGRVVEVGESFRLAARPNMPALLLMRTNRAAGLDVDVLINDRFGSHWRVKRSASHAIVALEIPAEQVVDSRISFRLTARKTYTTYHYWLVQRRQGR